MSYGGRRKVIGQISMKDFVREIHIQRSNRRRVGTHPKTVSTTLGPYTINCSSQKIRVLYNHCDPNVTMTGESAVNPVVCHGCGYVVETCDFRQSDNHGPDTVTAYFGKMTIDHIIPKSKGGSKNGISNMWLMCRNCNGKKGDMFVASNIDTHELEYIKAA